MTWGLQQRDFPVLTPGQMNPYNQAFQSGLQSYMDITKAKYEPIKIQAEAASKLAYANLMGPQFLAKLMGNDPILANMTEEQKTQALQKLYQAGSGGGTGAGILGGGQPHKSLLDSLVGWYQGKTNAPTGAAPASSGGAAAQPTQAGGQTQGTGADSGYSYDQNGNNVKASDDDVDKIVKGVTGNPDNAEISKATAAYMQSPEAQAKAQKEGMYTIPQTDELMQWYRQQQGAQPSPAPAPAPSVPGQPMPPPQPAPVVPPQPQRNFAEKAADYKGLIKEGETLGDIRAKDVSELNNAAFSAKTNETTFNELSDVLGSDQFRQIRQIPLALQHELAYYAKEGTADQQKMVGKYYTLTGNIIKDSSRDFAGQFRTGEQKLLEGMKPNPSDTVDTAIGKTQSLAYLNKMLGERSRLTSDLITKYHINKLQAQDIADKQVNGEMIRSQINNRLNPKPTDDDINFMAQKYKVSPEKIRSRLKDKGVL